MLLFLPKNVKNHYFALDSQRNNAKTQQKPNGYRWKLYISFSRKSVLLVTKLTLLDSPHLMLCRNCLNLTAFNLVRLVLHLNLVRFSLISPPQAYQTHQSRYLTPRWTHQCHLCLSRTWMLSFDTQNSQKFSLLTPNGENWVFFVY